MMHRRSDFCVFGEIREEIVGKIAPKKIPRQTQPDGEKSPTKADLSGGGSWPTPKKNQQEEEAKRKRETWFVIGNFVKFF